MMTVEILTSFIMSYPSEYGNKYSEEANFTPETSYFYTNDLLLCIMIFCRIHHLVRVMLRSTSYTEPRSQRMCQIYGAEANISFATKALMQTDSLTLVSGSILVTLIALSY